MRGIYSVLPLKGYMGGRGGLPLVGTGKEGSTDYCIARHILCLEKTSREADEF